MAGKKIRGRKRHLLVDTQGLLLSVKVLEADLGDREGGKGLLLPLVGRLPRLQVIWADSGYAGSPFELWVKEHLGVRLEIVNQAVVLPYRRWGIGAGALDTGTPLAIAGRMLANEEITRRGAFGPELCIPVEPFFQELARYDMHVTETRTTAIS